MPPQRTGMHKYHACFTAVSLEVALASSTPPPAVPQPHSFLFSQIISTLYSHSAYQPSHCFSPSIGCFQSKNRPRSRTPPSSSRSGASPPLPLTASHFSSSSPIFLIIRNYSSSHFFFGTLLLPVLHLPRPTGTPACGPTALIRGPHLPHYPMSLPSFHQKPI